MEKLVNNNTSFQPLSVSISQRMLESDWFATTRTRYQSKIIPQSQVLGRPRNFCDIAIDNFNSKPTMGYNCRDVMTALARAVASIAITIVVAPVGLIRTTGWRTSRFKIEHLLHIISNFRPSKK